MSQSEQSNNVNEHEILLSMLDAAENGQASEFRDTFDSLLRLKINDIVDQRKQELASSLGGVEPQEEEVPDDSIEEALEQFSDEELSQLLEFCEENELDPDQVVSDWLNEESDEETLDEGSSGHKRMGRVSDARFKKLQHGFDKPSAPSKDGKGRDEGRFNTSKFQQRGIEWMKRKEKKKLNEVKKVSSDRIPRGMTVRATPNLSDKDDARNYRRQAVPDGKGNWYPHGSNEPVGSKRTKTSMATSDSKFRKNKIKLRRRGPTQYNLFDKDINEGSKPKFSVTTPEGRRVDVGTGKAATKVSKKWFKGQNPKISRTPTRPSLKKEGYNQKHPGWDRITGTVSDYDKKRAEADAKSVEGKKAQGAKKYSAALTNYMKAQGKNPDGTPLKETASTQLDWARKQMEKRRAKILSKKPATSIKETSDDTVNRYVQLAKTSKPTKVVHDKINKKFGSVALSPDDAPEKEKVKKTPVKSVKPSVHAVHQRSDGAKITNDQIAAARERFQARLAATKARLEKK